MPAKKFNDKISKLYAATCAEAERQTIALARDLMRRHPSYVEFISAMGTAFLVDRDGDHTSVFDLGSGEPIADLFLEWDEYLKLTGNPLRFGVTGEIVREW